MKRLLLAVALVLGVLGAAILGAPAPSNAADLGVVRGARHIRHVERYWNWRDRCAFAGYYCLYAEYGFVYAYPFDDRPIASAYYARRHQHRYGSRAARLARHFSPHGEERRKARLEP